jgi:hypothetical protein
MGEGKEAYKDIKRKNGRKCEINVVPLNLNGSFPVAIYGVESTRVVSFNS